MFQNSVVSTTELVAFKRRTSQALEEENRLGGMKEVVEAFLNWPHVATLWCNEGQTRVEGGKHRTRNHHYISFVVTQEGLHDLENIYSAWQTHPLSERIQITLSRMRFGPAETETFGGWTFKLNYRPDPEVIKDVCEHWLKIANFTDSDH
ncbi:hypothetical protein G173_gp036 [Erwinia phage phiEaH2]|uniref:Uncharacterized protein n=1 Tax=Erwinia phage phiEaH2 TaxID=1029988 RepID=J7KC67_9CAUD|nr:hypothetical protein G173_gp036 [Erwinia phage phiEaH2]AFQ96581.1 hypothetical protein [Erwinia phage phiEaH2]